MLSIATLFNDEQRLLNRVWAVLLGLQALLVLFGTVSAVVRAVVAMRRRRAGAGGRGASWQTHHRPGGLRRADASAWDGYHKPRHVTIELPTEFDVDRDGHEHNYKGRTYADAYYTDEYADYAGDANDADDAYNDDVFSEKYIRNTRISQIVNSPSSKV